MAAPTNTVQVYESNTLREYLDRMIVNISPNMTPMLSRTKRRRARSIKVEYPIDSYGDHPTDAGSYGETYEYTPRPAPVRRTNQIQSIARAFIISDEEENSTHAGFSSRYVYEATKLGVEQRIAVEKICFMINQGAQVAASGNASVGKAASFLAQVDDTVAHGGGAGANGGWSTANAIFAARTDGTLRTATEDIFRGILDTLKVESDDGYGKMVCVQANLKKVIAGFAGRIPLRSHVPQRAMTVLHDSVDVYKSVYNDLFMVKYSRYTRNRDIIVYNPMRAVLYTFWFLRRRPIATTGNHRRFGMSSSFAIALTEPKAHGLGTDLQAAA